MTKETTETTEQNEYEGELPYTIKFKYPVQVGKETTLSELTFTEIPDGKATKHIQAGESIELGQLYPVIAAMTGKPQVQIEKIKYPDLRRCFPIATHFLVE